MTYLIKNKEYKIEFPHKDDLLLLLFDDNFGVELLKNIHAKIMHRNILDDNANYIRCFRLYEKIILYKKNNANTFNEVSFLYQNPDEAASLLRIYCGFGDSEWVDDLMVSHSSLTEDEFHERLKLLAQCSFNVLSSEDLIYGSSIKKADKMVVTLIFPTKKQRENYLFRYEQESKIIENEMQISINNNNVKEKIKKDNNLSKYMILFLVVCYVLVGK